MSYAKGSGVPTLENRQSITTGVITNDPYASPAMQKGGPKAYRHSIVSQTDDSLADPQLMSASM